MGIEMCRLRAKKLAEGVKLPRHFGSHSGRIVARNDLVCLAPFIVAKNPFAEIDMEADAQPRMLPRIGRCLLRRRLSHHQTRAGDDATLVRLDDSAIGAGAQAE